MRPRHLPTISVSNDRGFLDYPRGLAILKASLRRKKKSIEALGRCRRLLGVTRKIISTGIPAQHLSRLNLHPFPEEVIPYLTTIGADRHSPLFLVYPEHKVSRLTKTERLARTSDHSRKLSYDSAICVPTSGSGTLDSFIHPLRVSLCRM